MADLNERQKILHDYFVRCVQDNIASWAELASPKLLEVLSRDARAVFGHMGRRGFQSLKVRAGAALMQMASDLLGGK